MHNRAATNRTMSHSASVLAALLVTVLWSSSWVLVRFGLDDEALTPLLFAGLRYGFASALVVGWVVSRRHLRLELSRLDPSAVTKLAMLGLVFYTLTQGAQIVAIDSQPAATTSLLLSMTPLAVAAVSARTLKERISRQQFMGGVAAAFGALLYSSGQLGATKIGMTAAAIALVSNVTGGLMGRSINRAGAQSAVVVTAISMTAGSAILLGAGLAFEGWPSLSWRAAAIIAWLALVNTAFAFTLWNLSMRRLTALESAAINNTLLVQIAALAWLFLDEAPGWFGLAGIVLVSAGILQIQLASNPKSPAG